MIGPYGRGHRSLTGVAKALLKRCVMSRDIVQNTDLFCIASIAFLSAFQIQIHTCTCQTIAHLAHFYDTSTLTQHPISRTTYFKAMIWGKTSTICVLTSNKVNDDVKSQYPPPHFPIIRFSNRKGLKYLSSIHLIFTNRKG